MPGRRKFYKKYYKRKYKTLKKSNIFRKKSAKSQATQIYALNKKINRIYKQTAPEIHTYVTNQLNGFNKVFQGTQTDNDNGFFQQNGIISRLFNSSGHFAGDPGDDKSFSFKGNLLRVKGITLNLHFTRMSVASTLTGNENPIYTAREVGSQEKVGVVRITILRLSNSINSVNSMNYIHRLYKREASPAGVIWNTEDTVYGPLNDTITTMGKVIYDRKFRMGYYGNAFSYRNVKINLKGGTYRRPENFTENSIMGRDYIMCITYGLSGPGASDTHFMVAGDVLELNTACKIAYVDDTPGYTDPEPEAKVIELKKGPDFFGNEEGTLK